MPNRKFYIEYMIRGTLQRERIRTWANTHTNLFPEYGFSNTQTDFPTTHSIADRLEREHGFERSETNGEVILRNSNPNFRF